MRRCRRKQLLYKASERVKIKLEEEGRNDSNIFMSSCIRNRCKSRGAERRAMFSILLALSLSRQSPHVNKPDQTRQSSDVYSASSAYFELRSSP